MSLDRMTITKRALLGGVASTAAAMGIPAIVRAQDSGPIKIGALVPLSGGGAQVGASVVASARFVADEVNAAGGVLGRPVSLVIEDDQTNPENGVRATQKLINVDRVPAILGVWTSAVASAVAPLCWENKVMMLSMAGADSITQLPHQGYVARTQPNITQQAEQFARLAVLENHKHLFVMMPQTPFTDSVFQIVSGICEPKGIKVSALTYDGKKSSLRSEVDAMMSAAPDLLLAGGYQPDTVVLAKDVYRAGYKGKVMGFGYALNDQFLKGAGPQVTEGWLAMEPIPDDASTAYAKLQKALKRDDLDIYVCHGYDQLSLELLSIAAAKSATGTGIRDHLRSIGDPDGVKVDNAVDGLKALGEGKKINYVGATGPCKFLPNGDIASSKFRFTRVENGKFVLYKAM